jgi:putative NADPH-quinone reductase
MALIILAHPKFNQSVANKTIIEELKNSGLNIEIRNLSELYPDYKIDVKAEQEALLRHQNIVFQYPFYWYNIPAILKLWFDEIFIHQFAYGSQGDKLKGKNFITSITVGGKENDYQALGKHRFNIDDFSKSLVQTSHLAQMNYIDPFYCYGTSATSGNTKEEVTARAKEFSGKLISKLKSMG